MKENNKYLLFLTNYSINNKTRSNLRSIIFILIFIFIFSSIPINANALANSSTTSSKLISVTKKIIIRAAKVGIDQAGSYLMGPAWKYMKSALEPLFNELTSQIPGFKKFFGTSPNSEEEAKKAADLISKSPRLQNLIVNGFANLENGQREIINRIGEIQMVLEEHGDKIDKLAKLNEEKLNKIIEMLEKQSNDKKKMNYTSGITMYDLEGNYTLLNPSIDPNIPGCNWNVGELGMNIKAINAFQGRARIALPIGPSALFLEDLKKDDPQRYSWFIKQGIKETCVRLSDTLNVILYGTLFKIYFDETGTWHFAREVRTTKNGIMLTWHDDEGVMRYWDFRRD